MGEARTLALDLEELAILSTATVFWCPDLATSDLGKSSLFTGTLEVGVEI